MALRNCYWRSLIVAKNQGLKSISFSCISTGVYGFPNEKAAKTAFETVKKYLSKNSDQSIELIRFVCFQQKDFDLYKDMGVEEGDAYNDLDKLRTIDIGDNTIDSIDTANCSVDDLDALLGERRLKDVQYITYNSQEELKEILDRANKAYRLTGESELTDQQYDYLLTQVLDDDFKNKVGVEIEKNKIDLPVSMGSMTKIKTQEEVEAWYKSKNIISSLGEELMLLTPKFDGMSLLVKYEMGVYQKAYTRGDGKVGQDVTEHFRYTKLGKNVIDDCFSGYLIGEAIMKDKVFEKKYKGKYKNPRNMVAGVLSRKEITAELADIDFIAYNVVFSDDNFRNIETRSGEIGFLNVNNNKMFGFLIEAKVMSTKSIDQKCLQKTFDNLDTYQFDGIIIEVNNKYIQGTIGNDTNSLNPAYARAWKPASKDDATTTVEGVAWQISKTGAAKPVVQIEPVDLCGVTISNVTGINAKFMKENKIGVGSVITIIRSGDVIPKIVDIVVPCKGDTLPDKCPCCDSELSFNSTKVDLICDNKLCGDRVISSNADFLKILGVEEVGEGVVKQLYESGAKTIPKILSMTKEDFEKLDSFGERKAEITYNEIHSKLTDIPLCKLQHASNMFKSLGSTKLALLEKFDSRDNIPTRTEITLTDGYSDKSAEAYLSVIEDFWEFYEEISDYVTIKPYVAPIVGPLTDNVFVFTGGKPKDMISKIESLGGKLGSSVSKKTFALVAKDKGSGSSKETKAQKEGVKIMNWDELKIYLADF
jgi:NAD-dependent DNA ligase